MSADDHNPNLPERDDAKRARLDSLLERMCDQLATDDELAEINTLLGSGKSDRDYYLHYICLHSSLQQGVGICDDNAATMCAADATDSSSTTGHAASAPMEAAIVDGHSFWSRGNKSIYWGLASAATLLAVLLGAVTWWPEPAGGSRDAFSEKLTAVDVASAARGIADRPPAARVTQLSANVVWWNPNESIALMSQVGAGQPLRLSRGEIRLTYNSGVEMRLLGPAEFVVHAEGGNLRRGGLRAVVPEEGRGFTIETPNGKVVDLGTEFGVAVDDFGVSEVSVFQGIVDTFPISDSGDRTHTIRLTKGEAVQWNRETFIRLKADPLRFGDGELKFPINEELGATEPVLDEDLEHGSLDADQWRQLGDVRANVGSLVLQGSDELPYLVTAREFAPTDGPITVVCDIRFTEIDRERPPSFAVLTRSADERDVDAPENWRTMHTCVRCSFKSLDASSTGVVEAATKLDRSCPLTNMLWRGFDRLEAGVPYRLVMTDDGVNVSFTVSLRDDPSINKTVTCRSLFRGKENFIALEGPSAGAVAVDHIQVYHSKPVSATAGEGGDQPAEQQQPVSIVESALNENLDALAPAMGTLMIRDDFDSAALDPNVWTTLDEVAVIDGRVRLGSPNPEEHINTWTNRPYLLTKKSYAPAEGTLTIIGTVEFAENFLNEYGGSFAVMTRADDRHGSGPGWEYSILRFGVRANFWPAAWGQEHSLEIHEKPSPSTLSLLLAEGLEINPDMRQYLFKVVDDGERVTLTIQDAADATIHKMVSAPTNPSLRSGFIGFEGCWGCPLWLDNVRVYRTLHSTAP